MVVNTIDQYIKTFPAETQKILERIRQTIKKVAPKATEAISYGIPTFKLDGVSLVYFGGFKRHVGFYPTPHGVTAFDKELSQYKQGKGSAQFPLDKPIPYDIITKITKYRVEQAAKK